MRRVVSLLLTTPLLLTLAACDDDKPKVALNEATAKAIATEMTEKSMALLKNYSVAYVPDAPSTGVVDGNGYLITFAPAKLKMLAVTEEEDIGYAQLPGYTLHLSPETADTYKFTGEGYKTIGLMKKTGEKMAEVTVGKPEISGVWKQGTTPLSQYPQMSATWGDVSFIADNKNMLTIKQMATDLTSSVSATGLMDRSTKFSMEGLALNEEATKVRFSIQDAGFTYDEKGVDVAATEAFYKSLSDLQDKIAAMEAQNKAAETEHTPPAVTDIKDMIGGVADMMDLLAKMQGDTVMEGQINNIDFAAKDGGDDIHVELPKVKLSGKGDLGTNGLVSSHVSYSHSGLKITPLPEAQMADYIPADVTLAYGIENMPLTQLAVLLREIQADFNKAVEADSTKMPNDMFKDGKYVNRLIAILDEANAAFTIDDISFASTALSGESKGKIEANQNAKFKANGKIESVINGLDELMTKLQAKIEAGSKPDASDEAKADAMFSQSAMMGFTMIQAMGTPGTGLKGSTRGYTFELGEDGSVKLNGVDYAGLLSGFMMPSPHSYEDETYGDEPMVEEGSEGTDSTEGGEPGFSGDEPGMMEDDGMVPPPAAMEQPEPMTR